MESDNKPNDGVQPEGLSGQAAPSSPSPSESKEKQQPTTSGPNFQGDLPFRHPNPEDTLGSLTESHGEPSQKVLPIDGDIVQSWIKVLLEDRFVVLRGIDENVLFAAEHLVAKEHREKVPGLAVRRAILPGRPYRPIGRNETSKETAKTVPESDQCTIQMLSVANSEATPLLLIVQAYGRIDPSGFLDSLPSNRNELHTIQHGLGHHDRYILVLTKPEFLGVTNFRRELRSYAEPVDFLEPRLKHEFRDRPDLTKSLLKQREAELWWKVEDNHRTDEKFFQEVIDALQRKYLVELIDAGTSALQDKDPKQIPGATMPFPEHPQEMFSEIS